MSFSDVTRGQGSFVSRTKINERKGSFQVVRTVSGEIFEPTGSNANTAFIVTGHGYSLVGADGGKANRNKRIIPGEMRTDYKVFYLRYDENISYYDKIIELSLDFEGNVIIPYKREFIYRPETIQKYRSDNGRIEYIAVYCREEPSIRKIK